MFYYKKRLLKTAFGLDGVFIQVFHLRVGDIGSVGQDGTLEKTVNFKVEKETVRHPNFLSN